MEITCRVHRPRKPRESPLFQRVERHLEELLRVWPTRFARSHGPLRAVVERVAPTDKLRLEDAAAYLVRNPLSLEKLAYLDGEQAVIYRSRMNPSLGRNFDALDPLEWLARMSDHIPDPGQHRTLFYGEYSNRLRGSGQPEDREARAGETPEPRSRCSPTSVRLIAKVCQVDPLVCTRRGQRMSTNRLRHRPAGDRQDPRPPRSRRPPRRRNRTPAGPRGAPRRRGIARVRGLASPRRS